jgi:hypothetical protein
MIRLRAAGPIAALVLLGGGCAGDDEAPSAGAEKPGRTFEPHRIVLRDDRLLVVGVRVAAAGAADRPCDRGHDLVVLDVDAQGELGGVTEFPQEDLGDGDCIETIESAFLDRGAVLVSGWATIADPAVDGAGRYPYAVRLRPGDGPDEQFGEEGFIGLPHPTAGLAPFGQDLLYTGGVRFDRRGEVLDEFAFSYRAANGRVAPLPGARVAVVHFREPTPNYHVRIVGRDRVGPTTSVVVGRSTNYAEVTHVVPHGGQFFVLLESDTTKEVVHRHLADGRRDRSFGREGRVEVEPRRGRHGFVTGIAATPAAGLVVVGDLQEQGRRKAFVLRFDQRGRRLGTTVLDLAREAANDRHAFAAAAVQRDGKIVVAAGIQGRAARMYRLLPNGRPDREFGTDGSVALTLA